jgi:hypothetical protein
MWQLLGVEQIQNGGRCYGNQRAKNVQRILFKLDTNNNKK